MKKVKTDAKAKKGRFLPVESLKPNDYNPNRMDDEAFAELVAEVRHLGRVPKPIVVRPNGKGYVIVDGEHGWRAAKEAGHKQVLCDVVAVDDFEARRQTFKRNQHGEHNPVLLGQMFRQMMALRKLSQRALAKKIEVSEGTIRNAMVYAEALVLRNGYAPQKDHRQEIEELSVRAVREYVELPPPVGDLWLDAGGDLEDLEKALTCKMDDDSVWELFDSDGKTFLKEVVETGAVQAVIPGGFVRTMHAAIRLADWRSRHVGQIEDLDQYLPPVARLLRVWTVDPRELLDTWLPCSKPKEEETDTTDKARVAISPERWASILEACSENAKATTFGELEEMVKAALRLELKLQPELDLTDPRELEMLEKLKDAPEFIRNCDMTIFEKVVLANIDGGATTPEEAEVVLEAKRKTVKAMAEMESNREACEKMLLEEEVDDKYFITLSHLNRDITSVFNEELQKLVQDQMSTAQAKLLDDEEKLLEAAVAELEKSYRYRENRNKSALRQRLEALPWPERRFLLAFIVRKNDAAFAYWLNAVDPEGRYEPTP